MRTMMQTETTQTTQPTNDALPIDPHDAAIEYLRARADQQEDAATIDAPLHPEGDDGNDAGQATEGEQQPDDEGEGAPKDEAPKQELKDEPKKDESFAKRFAALQREERRIQQKRAELKHQEAELARFKGAIEKLKTDPLGALKELGVDYEDLTRRVLAGAKPDVSDEVKALRSKLEALERERQAEAERAQHAQIDAVFAAAKRDLAELSRDASKFPLASKWDAQQVADAAFQIIEQHFYKTGQPLSYDEALSRIESQLEELRRKFVGDTPPTSAHEPPKSQAPSPPKAITNRVATSQGVALADLPMEDRVKAAVEYLRRRRD